MQQLISMNKNNVNDYYNRCTYFALKMISKLRNRGISHSKLQTHALIVCRPALVKDKTTLKKKILFFANINHMTHLSKAEDDDAFLNWGLKPDKFVPIKNIDVDDIIKSPTVTAAFGLDEDRRFAINHLDKLQQIDNLSFNKYKSVISRDIEEIKSYFNNNQDDLVACLIKAEL